MDKVEAAEPERSKPRRRRRQPAVPSARAGVLPSSSKVHRLNDLALPHLESFDYCCGPGLELAVASLAPIEIPLTSRPGAAPLFVWLENAAIGMPQRHSGGAGDGAEAGAGGALFPAECRERGMTYGAPLTVTVCRRVGPAAAGGAVMRHSARLGDVPIMVRSRRCHLHGLSPGELVRAGEEAVEFGGYFICNGIERIIRMLQIMKRNHPMAITRGAYTNRGPLYSNKGVVIRCARPDQSTVTVTLHYLNDGSATVRFTVRKQEFFLPVLLVLKALAPTTDREIYERVLAGDRGNTYLSDRVLMLLREAKRFGAAVQSREAALAYLGARFRNVIPGVSESLSDEQMGQALLDNFVLVHIPRDRGREKFDLLLLMLRKLYSFVAGSVLEDNPDNLANQELLLSGHLILVFLKEKLAEFLQGVEAQVRREDSLYARLLSVTKGAGDKGTGESSGSSVEEEDEEDEEEEDEDEDAEEEEAEEAEEAVEEDSDEGFSRKRKARRKAKAGAKAGAKPGAKPGAKKGAKKGSASARAQAKTDKSAALARLPPNVARAAPVDLLNDVWFRKVVERQASVGRKVYYLLATGNMVSSTGLDMMQVSGYSVVADKLNFLRFTTHFRSVHRGQFFTEQKTTTVRKLLPENWGFLCPVHTPDGGPCGLLNHMSAPASVVSCPISEHDFALAAARASTASGEGEDDDGMAAGAALRELRLAAPLDFAGSMAALLVALGMTAHSALGSVMPATHLPILLDGRVLGGAPPHAAHRVARALRRAKALSTHVAARVDGIGGPAPPAQADEVSAAMRNAIAGLCGAGAAAAGEGEAALPSSLEGLGVLGVVPPSLEVAFIPPPWWDAEVDPHIADLRAAEARALRLGFPAADDDGDGDDGEGGAGAGAGAGARGRAGGEKKGEEDEAVPTKLVGLFPGLFLSSAPQRPLRPVVQLDTGLVEFLSPLEQIFMDIACTPEDVQDVLHVPLDAAAPEPLPAAAPAAPTAPEPADDKKGKKQRQKKKAAEELVELAAAAAAAAPAGASQAAPPLLYTHIELSSMAMLSELAALTPFSDMNQSPRNMYQCQMAKQTMGTPMHSWSRRTDTKLFRLLTPQATLVQNTAQSQLGLDEYPNGANACVAVISYTGFDMEDACIINKSSFERGFGWGYVYKTYEIDLMENRPSSDRGRLSFHNRFLPGEERPRAHVAPQQMQFADAAAARALPPLPGALVFESLDADGLPPVGLLVKKDDPLYCYLDATTGAHRAVRHKDLEPAYVDEVRLLGAKLGEGSGGGGGGGTSGGLSCVSIKLRFDRRPVVGDKFSSRHGQKGVLSYLWPQEDMPFSARGMSPDIIINPHAFPSRMTIGMLVESMAGKAGALHGAFQTSTPFRFNEEQRVVDYFGEQLRAAGYSHEGTETFFSGVTGEELRCDIFFGVVYYQRLRHMVKDKAQVRSTGPINALTRQPVQGRKKGGGVRFGEMERDSLLAHGSAFLLNDRLHVSSDRHVALVCKRCGSILAPLSVPAGSTVVSGPGEGGTAALHFGGVAGGIAAGGDAAAAAVTASAASAGLRSSRGRRQPHCLECGDGDAVLAVPVPYVFRYLANELAGMGIKVKLELSDGTEQRAY